MSPMAQALGAPETRVAAGTAPSGALAGSLSHRRPSAVIHTVTPAMVTLRVATVPLAGPPDGRWSLLAWWR